MTSRIGAYLALSIFAVFVLFAANFYRGAIPIGAKAKVAPPAVAGRCEDGRIGELKADGPAASRLQFIWEVTNASPSEETALFRASPYSYSVVKTDLLRGIAQSMRNERKKLVVVVIIGPQGPLWSYNITTVVEEDGVLRFVNTVFPHARITQKSAGETSDEEIGELAKVTAKSKHILRSGPSLDDLMHELEGRCWGEFNFDFLVAFFRDNGVAFRVSSLRFAPPAYRERVLEKVQALIEPAVPTYEHGVLPPNKALQQTIDPASRLAGAKRQSASSSAELGR